MSLEVWAGDAAYPLDTAGGVEILGLDGRLRQEGRARGPRDWLRLAPGGLVDLAAGPEGARLWVKTGHLSRMVAG